MLNHLMGYIFMKSLQNSSSYLTVLFSKMLYNQSMLKIVYGNIKDAIYNTSVYFDNTYLDNWITTPLAKKIIKNIDKGEVLSPQAIDTKALGVIPVTQISGGTKTLLLMLNEPEKIYNASTCDNNCAKYILEIADFLDSEAND